MTATETRGVWIESGQGGDVLRLYALLDPATLTDLLAAVGPGNQRLTATLNVSASLDPASPAVDLFSIRAWRIRKVTDAATGEVLYERDPVAESVGGWYHFDGSPCPVSLLPANSPDGYYWCTEHEQHLYATPPAPMLTREDQPARAVDVALSTAALQGVLAGRTVHVDVPAAADLPALIVAVRHNGSEV